jgi:hypothetical protein
MSVIFAGCEEGSGDAPWKSTGAPGVYSRYQYSTVEIANHTTGWVTAFAYTADYQGTLNLFDLVQSGAYVGYQVYTLYQTARYPGAAGTIGSGYILVSGKSIMRLEPLCRFHHNRPCYNGWTHHGNGYLHSQLTRIRATAHARFVNGF